MKNIYHTLRDRLTKSKKSFGSPSGWTSLDSYRQGWNRDNYKSYCFACINARAENVSKAKIYFYKTNSDGTTSEIKSHPFLEIIKSPNSRGQTFKELLHKITTSLDLYGNAYLLVHRGIQSRVIGLYHLPSKSIEIILNQTLTDFESYRYSSGSYVKNFKPRDIIHFMIPNPDSNFCGKATVDGFNYTTEIDFLQNQYQRNFYKNDAAIGMLLESEEDLPADKYERYVSQFRQMYEGAVNSGKTLLLEGGIKAKPYQAFPKDVEILPSRKMIRDEIMSVFRVPKVILGITDDVNRANSRESIKIFNDYVIKPFAKINIESKLNNFLRNNFTGDNSFIEMDYQFEIDRDLQLKAYEIFSKYNIASREEIRELEGLSN